MKKHNVMLTPFALTPFAHGMAGSFVPHHFVIPACAGMTVTVVMSYEGQ